MKNLLAHLTKCSVGHLVINVAIVLSIVGGYSYLLLTEVPSSTNSTCVFKNITSISCPGCGMGRSTWYLLRGELINSLYWHPLGILFNGFMLVAVLWAIRDIVRKDNSLFRLLTRSWPSYLILVFVLAILIVWGRNIVLGI